MDTANAATDHARGAQVPGWHFSALQHVARWLIRMFFHAVARVRVEGAENVPPTGCLVVVMNHLTLLDGPLLFAFLPRYAAGFVAVEYRTMPVVGWVLTHVGRVIFINRQQMDRKALRQGLSVLRAGGAVGVAPEGYLSTTGGLHRGQPGAAYLALSARAPVLPVGVAGIEKLQKTWKRLRRANIHIQIGKPMLLSGEEPTGKDLQAHTDRIMLALARLIPVELRGVYTDACQADEGEDLPSCRKDHPNP